MALSDAKILESERNAVYVKSNQGARLLGTIEENKNAFDKFPQLNMDKHNSLIDLLTALGLDSITTDLSDRYTKTEANTKISEETNDLVETIEYTKEDGKFKVTTKGGTVTTIDTDLEKIPASFELITLDDGTYLRITNQDGSYTQTNVTALIDTYTFNDSDTVDFTEDPKHQVTAVIKPNSITLNHLSLEIVSTIEGYVSAAAGSANAAAASATNAETSAANANTFMEAAEGYRDGAAAAQTAAEAAQTAAETAQTGAQTAQTGAQTAETNAASSASMAAARVTQAANQAVLAESYAKGGTGTRTGEDTDNSKYYMEQAKQAAIQAIGFDYQGAWDDAKAYTTSQIVSYDSTLWTATDNNINSIPYEGSLDWAIFIGVPSILDLGDFTDATLAAHVANLNAHDTMTIDANTTEATTQETLEEHETASDAHGNINIDGGGN